MLDCESEKALYAIKDHIKEICYIKYISEQKIILSISWDQSIRINKDPKYINSGERS